MKHKVVLWQSLGFVSVLICGTLLHFLYVWTDSKFVALFSAVNESTWEHMKLVFFPMFVFSVAENFLIGKSFKSFWCIKLQSIILSLVLVPMLFYTLNGVFGTTPGWANIGIFIVSVAVGFLYEFNELEWGCSVKGFSKLSLFVLFVIMLLFFVFTFYAPNIPIFLDPITGSCGINIR